MKQANKWTVKDVITTVLLTVLLIVIQLVVNMVCMVNDFVSMVLSVGFTMLLCAPVYFLMVSRIHKRFVSLIYMTILGCVFLIMGNWYLLPYYIVVGLICEAILWKNGWESKGKMESIFCPSGSSGTLMKPSPSPAAWSKVTLIPLSAITPQRDGLRRSFSSRLSAASSAV